VRLAGIGDIEALTDLLSRVESGAMLLAVRELVVTQPEPTAASTKAEALHFEVLVEGLTMKPGVPAADGKVP
jgi:hypothetical protein